MRVLGSRIVRVPAAAGWADRSLDVAVLGLASWTAAFHIGARLGWTIGAVLLLWSSGLAATLWMARQRQEEVSAAAGWNGREGSVLRPLLVLLSFGSVALAIGALALDFNTLFWLPAAASIVLGWFAVRSRDDRPTQHHSRVVSAGWWALGLALLAALHSATTTEWVPDNSYYVDRAYAIADGGPIPIGVDTMHSDGAFPSTAAENDLASLEGLIGGVSWLSGVHPMSVLSFVVHPLIAALGVLALWRAVRALGVPHPELATIVGWLVVFSISRSAEVARVMHSSRTGRTALLVVLVPLVIAWTVELARRPGSRTAWLLAAAAIAGVGSSLTAFVVLPLVAVAGFVAGWSAESRAASWKPVLAPGLVAVAYGTAILAWARSLGRVILRASGPVPEAGELWQRVLGRSSLYLLVTLAVLMLWFVAPGRTARRFSLAAPAAVLFLLAPPVLAILNRTPAKSAPDRVVWVLPLAVLAAIGVSGLLVLRPRWLAGVVAGLAVVATATVLPRGPDLDVGVPNWDVHHFREEAAATLVSYAEKGTTVAAPWEIAPFIGIVSTDVYPVAGRQGAVEIIGSLDPSIEADLRLALVGFVRLGVGLAPSEVGPALDRLGVTAACLGPRARAESVRQAFSDADFEQVDRDGACEYWVKSD